MSKNGLNFPPKQTPDFLYSFFIFFFLFEVIHFQTLLLNLLRSFKMFYCCSTRCSDKNLRPRNIILYFVVLKQFQYAENVKKFSKKEKKNARNAAYADPALK